jgi:WD40 repeat protein
MGESTMIDTGILERNPFPGVRPFTSAEDKYFFGRDEAVRELLDTLLVNHFVALIGASGTGKTSLIQSGIIPELLASDSGDWVPINVRPGTRPLDNLLSGFQQVFPTDLDNDDVQSFTSGNMSLGEWVRQTISGKHNYLIIVDQFEEIFRIGQPGRSEGKNPEASRLVKLLMEVVNEKMSDFYVILSIRSDFIDACSKYIELTEQMNRSKYLLPAMSNEAISTVIRGPIKLAGAEIEPGFVDQLLEDLKEVDEKLPHLQYSLMRTWDLWTQKRNTESPISVNDYLAAGTIGTSLNDHLDGIYNSLDEKQKVICARLFKTITAKGEQPLGYRRLVSLGNIARIAQCSLDEVAEVVSIFRRPGRQFLLPPSSQSLTEKSIIELAHESLITAWKMLKNWVEEESESIQIYLRLSKASEMYQQGRTELWKHPELQQALDWRETQKPTPSWGIQFNPAFERAMVFLSTSEEEYLWEEERKILLQRRKLIINRSITIGMSVVVVVLAVVFFLGRNRPVTPQTDIGGTTQQELATSSETERDGSGVGESPGEGNTDASIPRNQESLPGSLEEEGREDAAAITSPAISEYPSGRTERTQTVSRSQPVPAAQQERVQERRETPPRTTEQVRRPAEPTTRQAEPTTRQAEPTTRPAESPDPANSAAMQRRAISLAKNIARASTEIAGDPDLQGLLAYQSYQINDEFSGKDYDADIYNGLYAALKKLISPAYNIYPNIRNSINSIVWLRNSNSMVTASSDGSIMILPGNVNNRATQTLLTNTGLNNESLCISPDESILAVGTNGGGLLFLDLHNRGSILQQSQAEGNTVLFLRNLGNSGSFISAGPDTRIVKWNYLDYTVAELIDLGARPSAIATSSNGSQVAIGTRDGKLYEFNPGNPGNVRTIMDFGSNNARSAVYSPGGQFLAVGLLDGSIRILAGQERSVIASLKGPAARVSDLAYSPDGRFLAAASNDGNVYLWNSTDWSQAPMVFSENKGFVLTVCFSQNSSYFYSGSTEFPRLIARPSESAGMAADFCNLLSRNLTQAEWDQYFGDELAYRKTCPNLK